MFKRLFTNKKWLILLVAVLVLVAVLIAVLAIKDSKEGGKPGMNIETGKDKDDEVQNGEGLEVEDVLDESVSTIDGSGDWGGSSEGDSNTNDSSSDDTQSDGTQSDGTPSDGTPSDGTPSDGTQSGDTEKEESDDKDDDAEGKLNKDTLEVEDDKVWGEPK